LKSALVLLGKSLDIVFLVKAGGSTYDVLPKHLLEFIQMENGLESSLDPNICIAVRSVFFMGSLWVLSCFVWQRAHSICRWQIWDFSDNSQAMSIEYKMWMTI
jgi:hypothetical protein